MNKPTNLFGVFVELNMENEKADRLQLFTTTIIGLSIKLS